MGLFSGLGKLAEAAIDVATSPLDVASDILNAGDGRRSRTAKKAEDVEEELVEALRELLG